MPDQNIESALRSALHAEADGLPIRLTAAELRARARPPRPWWSLSPAMATTAVVIAAVLVGVIAFSRLPGTTVGSPRPSATTEPTPTAPPTSDPTASTEPRASAAPTPSVSPSPDASPTLSPRPGMAIPQAALLIRQTGMEVEVGALSADGTVTSAWTVALVRPGAEVSTASLSGDGFLAVVEQVEGEPSQYLLYDLQDREATPRVVADVACCPDFGPTGLLALTPLIDGGLPSSDDIQILVLDPWTGQTDGIGHGYYASQQWLADGSGFLVQRPEREELEILLLDDTTRPIDGRIPPLEPAYAGTFGDTQRPISANGDSVTVACPSGGTCFTVVTSPDGSRESWGVGQDRVPEIIRTTWDAEGVGLWFVSHAGTTDAEQHAAVWHFDRPTRRDVAIDVRLPDFASVEEIAFAPDDSYLLVGEPTQGGLVRVDLPSGRARQVAEGWRFAGWGPGFPDYPVDAP